MFCTVSPNIILANISFYAVMHIDKVMTKFLNLLVINNIKCIHCDFEDFREAKVVVVR